MLGHVSSSWEDEPLTICSARGPPHSGQKVAKNAKKKSVSRARHERGKNNERRRPRVLKTEKKTAIEPPLCQRSETREKDWMENASAFYFENFVGLDLRPIYRNA